MKNESHKQFSSCVFNPFVNGNILNEYPRLAEIVQSEWAADPNLNSILRYVICLYDPKSPLLRDEPDLNYRKQAAADLAEMPDEIRDDVFGSNYPNDPEMETEPFMADLIFEYLKRFARSKEFAAIAAMEFKYWEQIKQMLTPITGKNSKEELEATSKKNLIAAEIEPDMKRIDNFNKLFFGDEDLAVKIKKRLTPEGVSNLK